MFIFRVLKNIFWAKITLFIIIMLIMFGITIFSFVMSIFSSESQAGKSYSFFLPIDAIFTFVILFFFLRKIIMKKKNKLKRTETEEEGLEQGDRIQITLESPEGQSKNEEQIKRMNVMLQKLGSKRKVKHRQEPKTNKSFSVATEKTDYTK